MGQIKTQQINRAAPIPARIHVILAREARFGVVFRRGPSKQFCTLGWNLEDDSFALGQWLKGRTYPFRADLSPDGQHLIYFAANFGGEPASWTAISRAPFLKASGFWPKGDAWHGGGLFIDNRRFWINDGYHSSHQESRTPPRLKRAAELPNFQNYGGEDPGVYFLRLQRDGWKMGEMKRQSGNHEIFPFEKRVNDHWILRKFFHATLDKQAGKGCYYDSHELFHRKSGEIIDASDWEWAEIDRRRIVWAQNGRLFAARLNDREIYGQKLLRDFNAMQFENKIAPY